MVVTLSAALRIERPDIVVHDARRFVDYLFVELLSTEEGEIALCI